MEQGRIAMVPERPIELGIWRGVGYVLEDPATGDGAYMVSGALAGGLLVDCLRALAPRWIDVRVVQLAMALVLLLVATAVFLPQVWEAAISALHAFYRLFALLRFAAPLAAA